jgi:hypothetical protein
MADEQNVDPLQTDLLKQGWFENWRLYAAWLYIIIVLFDFLLAPIGHLIILSYFHMPYAQWQPITIQGGGIFHISMLSIIGVATFTHGQQQLEAIRNMPDYSAIPYSQIVSEPYVNPTPPPPEPLQASHRGIPKGK